MKEKFDIIESSCVPLPIDNIDTDQIIPARFLKSTRRDEKYFGDALFYDRRFNPDGSVRSDFPLNDPRYSGSILVAGRNFGCGSSREHAAWALAGHGFRVVVAPSFADIHRQNELNNFVLPVEVSEDFVEEIFSSIEADSSARLRVDVPARTLVNLSTGRSETFPLDPYKQYCLVNALDDIDFILERKDLIEKYEKNAA